MSHSDLPQTSESRTNRPSILVAGVGGAGCALAAQIGQLNMEGVRCAALNTDARSLESLVMENKHVLGTRLTRGLGAGGDPDIGRAAALEDSESLRRLCAGADIVFVTAGLGGGTGTGASTVLAQAARDSGALVLAIVTTPFEFEGGRRQRQAQMGLRELREAADAVICLPNQKLFHFTGGNSSLVDTFRIANELLAKGVHGIWRMLSRTGLVNLDFADLCAATRGSHAQSCLASAEASGENRAQEVVDKLLKHPLLEKGALEASPCVLVSLAGDSTLTLREVNSVMEQLNRHTKASHVIFGAHIEEGSPLSVTLIASASLDPEQFPERSVRPESARQETASAPAWDEPETVRPPSRFAAPPPVLPEEKKVQLAATRSRGSRRKKNIHAAQGQLPLEIVSKGRFEKSEPTIHAGTDLDVPTYIRRRVTLN